MMFNAVDKSLRVKLHRKWHSKCVTHPNPISQETKGGGLQGTGPAWTVNDSSTWVSVQTQKLILEPQKESLYIMSSTYELDIHS